MMLEHASSNSRARGYIEGLVLGETQSMNRNNTICSLYWQLKRVFVQTPNLYKQRLWQEAQMLSILKDQVQQARELSLVEMRCLHDTTI